MVKQDKFSKAVGEKFTSAWDIFNDGFIRSLNSQFKTQMGKVLTNHWDLIDPSKVHTSTAAVAHHAPLAQTFLSHVMHKVALNHGVDFFVHGVPALTHTIHALTHVVAYGIACGTGAITLGVIGTAVAHMLVVAVPFHAVKFLIHKHYEWKAEEERLMQEKWAEAQLQLKHSDFDFIAAERQQMKMMAEQYGYFTDNHFAADHPFAAFYLEHCRDEECKQRFYSLVEESRLDEQKEKERLANLEIEKANEEVHTTFLASRFCDGCAE